MIWDLLLTKAVPTVVTPNSNVVRGMNQPGPMCLQRSVVGISKSA